MGKNYGLRLTLGGAPAVPHTVPGVPGFFRPDEPTPVGDDHPVSLVWARELDKDESVELELVELKPKPARARRRKKTAPPKGTAARAEALEEQQEKDARKGEVTDPDEVS
jgi:hypothetical protein